MAQPSGSGSIELTAELKIHFNGRPIPAREGDSVIAALIAAGIQSVRLTRSGQPRGAFCGMGVCQDCLVIIDGQRSQRACMVPVHNGMEVRTQSDAVATRVTDANREGSDDGLSATMDSDEGDSSSDAIAPTARHDLIVIGGGPAGLNAAIPVAEGGLDVTVIDERHDMGGQYYKPRTTGARINDALDDQHRRGDALRERARSAGVKFRGGETLWYARAGDNENGFELGTVDGIRQHRLSARSIVLATGAFEKPAIVPGWTLPGVMTIGAGQTLVRRYGVAPGKRILIAGHGPLGLQLAAELSRQGVKAVELFERARPSLGFTLLNAIRHAPQLVLAAVRYRLRLLRAGIPVHYGHEVTAIEGDGRVERVLIANLRNGRTRHIDVDAVCMGDGFAPQLELARLLGCEIVRDATTGEPRAVRDNNGATSVAGVWLAGDAGGLEGAASAEAQGEVTGEAVLAQFGRLATPGSADASEAANEAIETRNEAQGHAAKKALTRARSFQRALWTLYQAPEREPPSGDTVMCRCEEIPTSRIENAIKRGATSLTAIKGATRLGMGRCQGRYCVPAATRLLANHGMPVPVQSLFAPQLPARPVSAALLLREKPEWSGHRESSPAARPALPRREPLQASTADIVIIGAGVTGICAALFAARAGARVVCLDRGLINGEASGGNAGSLHLQLLSWDFGGKAAGDGSAALATLALQQESIALWRELEQQTDADFEMQETGGLMVAESHEQIAFLERKVRAEASVGIRSEVIDADRLRDIVPSIARRMVAASWCPGEGKINPLLAMPPLVLAAREAGAMIEELAAVESIDRMKDGYRVRTAHGSITSPRIIIAAGGWSAQLGAMLGVELPIRGAPLQMLVTEPAPPLVPCLLAHADRHLTMKQSQAGSLIIGGAWTADTAPSGQTRVLLDSLEGNLWVATRTVPAIRNLQLIRSWAAMNIDVDGAPLLGPLPGLPGVVIAASANGYTLGPLMGREAAAMALNDNVAPALKRFGLSRFSTHQETHAS